MKLIDRYFYTRKISHTLKTRLDKPNRDPSLLSESKKKNNNYTNDTGFGRRELIATVDTPRVVGDLRLTHKSQHHASHYRKLWTVHLNVSRQA